MNSKTEELKESMYSWLVSEIVVAEKHGVEVNVDEPFPNGALWPGDDSTLSPDESCGCNCSTEVIIES